MGVKRWMLSIWRRRMLKRSISREILDALKDWDAGPATGLDDLLRLSEKSLTEVKHLTEYEDEKANRILTAVAFLSALAGVLYVSLLPRSVGCSISLESQAAFAATLYHMVFGVYVFCTVLGAYLVIKAVRPNFNIPKDWGVGPSGNRSKTGNAESPRLPPSFLFFEKIIAVGPADWANAFVKSDVQALKIQYITNCIHETYLVADKIRSKLRWLQPGVRFLQFAVLVLALWVPICGWSVFVESSDEEGDGQAESTHTSRQELSPDVTDQRPEAPAKLEHDSPNTNGMSPLSDEEPGTDDTASE